MLGARVCVGCKSVYVLGARVCVGCWCVCLVFVCVRKCYSDPDQLAGSPVQGPPAGGGREVVPQVKPLNMQTDKIPSTKLSAGEEGRGVLHL